MTVHPGQPPTSTHRAQASTGSKILMPLVAGALVAVGLGVYGRLHAPTGIAVNIAGFSGAQSAKSWLTSAALVFALVQLGSALAMEGKLPGGTRAAPLHRWSGRAAVLLTVPVVLHCLYALGLQPDTPRVLIHSLLGCFFFGAFVTKMLVLTRHGVPGWALPVIGGLVFSSLVGIWLTSSLWFFTTFGLVV
ncbi:MAG: DUF6529 family protein [Actinomycetes bacterium]